MASAEIGIIDVATSALRAVAQALPGMYNIRLTELPTIYKEPVFSNAIHCTEDDYVTVIKLKHAPSLSSGYVIICITKDMAKKLLEESGLGVDFKPSEIMDSCGELCNLLAGFFKMEMDKLGHKDIHLSTPRVYSMARKDEDSIMTGIYVNEKYTMAIGKKGHSYLNLEIAFQSKNDLSEKASY